MYSIIALELFVMVSYLLQYKMLNIAKLTSNSSIYGGFRFIIKHIKIIEKNNFIRYKNNMQR